MKKVQEKIKIIFSNKTNILVALVFVLALLLRLVNLGWPDWQVFDEIYYNNFARDYLTHTYFFDVHPPLGKLFISLAIFLFGDNFLSYRFFQAIVGALVVLLIYFLAKVSFKKHLLALFALILATSSTMLLVESRLSLLNIFILFFALISYLYFWFWATKGKASDFYLCLVFISLASAIKWTGAFNLLVFLLFIAIDSKSRKQFSQQFSPKFIFFSFVSLVVPYLLFFSANILQGDKLFKWHLDAFNFHANLSGNHPYASPWWKWFIGARPIWLDFRTDLSGNVYGMVEIENPITLLLALISLVFNVLVFVFKKDRALGLVILAVIVNTLPWVFIKRESFFYHFLPILPFMIISLAYWFDFLYKEIRARYLVAIFLVLAVGFFIWYWPLLTDTEIPYNGYLERAPIQSWR